MVYEIKVSDEKGARKNYRMISVSGETTFEDDDKFCDDLQEAWNTRPEDTGLVCLNLLETKHLTSSTLGKIIVINKSHRESYDKSPVSVIAEGQVYDVFKKEVDRIVSTF